MTISSRCWIPGLITLVCCFVNVALAYPLCASMEAPTPVSQNLGFCSAPEYKTKGCCQSKDDNAIKRTFESMDISDANCATVVKQILCAQCDAFSATLFGHMVQDVRKIPYLCNTTSKSSLSTSTGQGYCQDVWEACASIPMKHSIFAPLLIPGASSPSPSASSNVNLAAQEGSLGSVFKSKEQFCAVAGPSAATGEEFCFDGAPFVAPPAPSDFALPQDMCLEKVGEDVYLNLVPFPDGSNRAAVSNQAGTVWLVTLEGPGKSMVYNISQPFLDISDRVTNQNELGFLGFAFHPDFKVNGRFFVSYNCDKQKWADCGGICACNKQTNCNPSDLREGQLGGDGGMNPCRYSSIVAEYTVNSSSNPNMSPLEAEIANPLEVRRIFTMALPYTTHHAGGLLFGPLDKYLYFMMGDGGNTGDPFNFAQNKKSLLGKIMRLDVDNVPGPEQISEQDLWGEYSIPHDNPYFGSSGSRPEIWALGLRNPWRCSFDSQYPTYLYCGDVGQETVEEVNVISKGGNYGWRIYEGNYSYTPPLSPGGNTSARSVQTIFPILQYLHSSMNSAAGFSAITGGYVSYSREDPCLYGKYVYADLFGTMWVGAEAPRFSGNFKSTRINYLCSGTSPLQCSFAEGNSTSPLLQEILSFGVDNSNNLYVLASNGVYRVVHPRNCNSVCNQVLPALPPIGSPAPSGTPPTVPGASTPAPSPVRGEACSLRTQLLHGTLAIILAIASVLNSIL